jgi:hypothetical protein
VLADAAEAIANGAASAFGGSIIRLMCYAHVYKVSLNNNSTDHQSYLFTDYWLHVPLLLAFIKQQNMQKKMKDCNGRMRELFLADLNLLSRAWSEECFDQVSFLFVNKWESLAEEGNSELLTAVRHFKNYWLRERLRRFYTGAAPNQVNII